MKVTVLNNIELLNRLKQIRNLCKVNTILCVDDLKQKSKWGTVSKIPIYKRNYEEKVKEYEKFGYDIIATLPEEKEKYYINIPVIVFRPFTKLFPMCISDIVELANSQSLELVPRETDGIIIELTSLINDFVALNTKITEIKKLKATLEFKCEISPKENEEYIKYMSIEETLLQSKNKLSKKQLRQLQIHFLKLSEDIKKLVLKNTSQEKLLIHFERCTEIKKLESQLSRDFNASKEVYNKYNLACKERELNIESIQEMSQEIEDTLSIIMQYEKDLKVLDTDKSLKGFIEKLITDQIIQIHEEPVK